MSQQFKIVKYEDVEVFQVFRQGRCWWTRTGGNYAYLTDHKGAMIRDSATCQRTHKLFRKTQKVGVKVSDSKT